MLLARFACAGIALLILRTTQMSWADYWAIATSERTLAALRLSFGAALLGALINAVFGVIVAWVLVRYEFPGKRIFDSLIDVPLALPGRLLAR